ncbi:YdcF family protein [[Clostridium] polysaccharolyticum]|uniref:Uncharacterized SAM-binding protein YcdF, DUF218 family n=1 Tax=[Clostridium] polysaccharolyticum TaxID=29364 RepID=A0A1I0C7Z1_9FIRM|nr:YdcF family protein [[Clostridium] polysaccharolyticum]SET15200.1 Uncharacterized SAM-binding protein YcdF, DUF218 family [[Clostridium] polysaccharolyticum]
MEREDRKLFWIKWILVAAGILAIIYYGMIVSVLGVRKDFSLIWPAAGVCCFGLSLLIREMGRHPHKGSSLVLNGILIVAVLLTAVFGILEGIIIKNGFMPASKDADYMIVLGAQVNGTKVSKALRYRLDAAYDYAVKNKNTKIIVSGAQGYREDVTEAQAMRDYLVEKGISEKRILMEEKSTNTNENIKYSKELLENADYVVIVTNRFHLFRGVRIARKQLSQKVEGVGADTGTVLFLNYYVREAFAVIKDGILNHI